MIFLFIVLLNLKLWRIEQNIVPLLQSLSLWRKSRKKLKEEVL